MFSYLNTTLVTVQIELCNALHAIYFYVQTESAISICVDCGCVNLLSTFFVSKPISFTFKKIHYMHLNHWGAFFN